MNKKSRTMTFRGLFQKFMSSSKQNIQFVKVLINPLDSSAHVRKFSKLSSPLYESLLTDHWEDCKMDEKLYFLDRKPSNEVKKCTKMIGRFVQSGKLVEALQLFDKMPVKDVVTWNLMIKGCLECGDVQMGLRVFDEMPERNVVSWTTVVNGLLKFGRVEEAERLFWLMPVRDIAAWNAMVYGYFENFRVDKAVELFEAMPYWNVISWTCMISGLDQQGKSGDALLVFRKMVSLGVEPTSCTLSSVITACASTLELCFGVQIHGRAMKSGCNADAYVTASLITFYANCKRLDYACEVFNEDSHVNVVVWTSLLTGCGSNGKHEEALHIYRNMIRNNIPPNQSSFSSVLNSCCEIDGVDQGKEIHCTTLKFGLDNDVFVGNSLVVLYFKFGCIKDGAVKFAEISDRNIVSWNSIIVGCAQHGCGREAVSLFGQMIRAGFTPDDITFTGLLSACSHSGLLLKGRSIFNYLHTFRSTEVKLEHYACMVDGFCRNGQLDEAEKLIKDMPMSPNLSIWLALLNGCRKHSNFEIAERVTTHINSVYPDCTSGSILLSNMYAFTGRWKDAARIRSQMRKKGIIKQQGRSWIIQKGVRHTFVSGDTSHPLTSRIYEKVNWLGEKLKEFGYVPDQRYALHDVEDEQKDSLLAHHSERLAICFALLTSVEGRSTITVMKNLRVCGDCHSAIKIISRIVDREIVLRDSSRFHHFGDGLCSCNDYW